MNMFDTLYTTEIEHDGGIADAQVTVNHDGTETATIRFGSSFTLRVDENNLDDLIEVLRDASSELGRRRAYMQSGTE
jgi:hypothetical protein